jgi:hypothetical protein
VQNSAPMNQLGAATSTLTFLRQIGGSVGLAIAGTLFSQRFTQELPGRLLAQGVPSRVVKGFASGSGTSSSGNLTGVNLAAQLGHTLPAPLHRFIPNIVAGIDDAFSLAVGHVFWLTVAASVLALGAVLAVADLPLREQTSASAEAADLVTGGDVPVIEGSAPRAVAQ